MYLEPTHRIVGGEVNSLWLPIVTDQSLPSAAASLQHVKPHQYLVPFIPKHSWRFDGQLGLQSDVLLQQLLLLLLLCCWGCGLVEYPKVAASGTGGKGWVW